MREKPGWTERLGDEDLMFIKRFVLASGSLKALAGAYGVSYPTVRLRLDRLIARIEVLEDEGISSEFERDLFALHAEGKLDMDCARRLLASHREEMEGKDEVDRSDG